MTAAPGRLEGLVGDESSYPTTLKPEEIGWCDGVAPLSWCPCSPGRTPNAGWRGMDAGYLLISVT